LLNKPVFYIIVNNGNISAVFFAYDLCLELIFVLFWFIITVESFYVYPLYYVDTQVLVAPKGLGFVRSREGVNYIPFCAFYLFGHCWRKPLVVNSSNSHVSVQYFQLKVFCHSCNKGEVLM